MAMAHSDRPSKPTVHGITRVCQRVSRVGSWKRVDWLLAIRKETVFAEADTSTMHHNHYSTPIIGSASQGLVFRLYLLSAQIDQDET